MKEIKINTEYYKIRFIFKMGRIAVSWEQKLKCYIQDGDSKSKWKK